jgi:hypothetical protein
MQKFRGVWMFTLQNDIKRKGKTSNHPQSITEWESEPQKRVKSSL